jgi:hypothetical protein
MSLNNIRKSMNIIKMNHYEEGHICPICQEFFTHDSRVVIVKHIESQTHKTEKIEDARRKRHLFHQECIQKYFDSLEMDPVCPLDRIEIGCLVRIRYHEVVPINLLQFVHNYYELIDQFAQDHTFSISIIDQQNLNCKDNNGKTLIYCTCQRGNLLLLKRLLKLGGNPIIADDNSFTPLMAAVNHGDLKIVRCLLNCASVIDDINHTDKTGRNAIDYAFISHHYECLIELIGVKNVSKSTLEELLSKIIYMNQHDPLLKEIKHSLRNTLQTKRTVKKTLVPISLEPKYKFITRGDHPVEPNRVFSPDLERHPELLDTLYRPLENLHYTVPSFTEQEIMDSTHFNYVPKDDLIYRPHT